MSTYRQLVCTTLSTNFRQAISIETKSIPTILEKSQLLIRHVYVGINASDINMTNGKYNPGQQPPFPIGFEAGK